MDVYCCLPHVNANCLQSSFLVGIEKNALLDRSCFSAALLGRLPQFSALLWLQRPILIQPWVTQFSGLTSFHILAISVWPLISWSRGIISTASRKVPSIWTHPADQKTLEVGIKCSWEVAFILHTHPLAEAVLKDHLGSWLLQGSSPVAPVTHLGQSPVCRRGFLSTVSGVHFATRIMEFLRIYC